MRPDGGGGCGDACQRWCAEQRGYGDAAEPGYNIEEYLDIKEYECSHCKKIFKSSEKRVNKYYYTGMFKNDNIDKEILNEHINEIKKYALLLKTL